MFIALSLFLPYFFGIGHLVRSLLAGRSQILSGNRQDAARDIAVPLMCGILTNYLLVLLLGRLDLVLTAGSLLAVLGLVSFFRSHGSALRTIARTSWITVCVMLFLALLYSLYIFAEPLTAWDARSIWFFHGKMIFYNDGFTRTAGWTDPAVQFSHIEYPKLAAALSAQFARLAGFWNEHFPKAALLALLVPALFAVQSFFSARRAGWFLLVACLLFGLRWWLWNGYMDGYLALYAALSALYLGRWLDAGDVQDGYAGMICLGMVGDLKTEGTLFILVIAICLIALRYRLRNTPVFRSSGALPRGFWLLMLFSALGPVLWQLIKWRWGISNAMPLDLARIPARLADGSLNLILGTLLLKNGVALALGFFVAVLGAARAYRLRPAPSVWLAFLTSVLYFAGMTVVYLATSNELPWHLATSSERTMLPVLLCLGAGAAVLVNAIETAERAPAESLPRKSPLRKKR